MEYDSVSRGARAMFFMLTPNESSFEKVEDVPQYVQQVGVVSFSFTTNTSGVLGLCWTRPIVPSLYQIQLTEPFHLVSKVSIWVESINSKSAYLKSLKYSSEEKGSNSLFCFFLNETFELNSFYSEHLELWGVSAWVNMKWNLNFNLINVNLWRILH